MLNMARSGSVEQGPGPPTGTGAHLNQVPAPETGPASSGLRSLAGCRSPPRPSDLAPEGREGAGVCGVGAADSCQTFTLPRCRDVSHIPEVRGFLISGLLGFWVTHTDTQHTADVTGSADGSNGVSPRVPEGPSPCPGQWPGVSLSASKGGEEPAIADPCLPPWDAGSGHLRLPLAPVASPGESRLLLVLVMLVTCRARGREAPRCPWCPRFGCRGAAGPLGYASPWKIPVLQPPRRRLRARGSGPAPSQAWRVRTLKGTWLA